MSSGPEVRIVDAVVFALVPEFRQVRVKYANGRHYALTRRTKGIDMADLKVGQSIICTVTARTATVLLAAVVRPSTGIRPPRSAAQ